MTTSAARMVRIKQQWWKSYRSGRSTIDEYKLAEKKAKKELRKSRRNYEKQLAKEMKRNPRKFYSYVNGKNKRTGVGPLKDADGNILASDREMAEEFNVTFASVFGKNGATQSSPHAPHVTNLLTTIQFPPEVVEHKLRSLKPSSAPGPDGIHPRLLRECAG